MEYDRVREVNLPIESNIQVRSGTGYYAGTPVLSADNVTISGPPPRWTASAGWR